jgi:LCP family protein required for cell wall assembly
MLPSVKIYEEKLMNNNTRLPEPNNIRVAQSTRNANSSSPVSKNRLIKPVKSKKMIIIRIMVYLLIAIIGLGTGALKYGLDIFGSSFVKTPFVKAEDYKPIDIGSLDDYDLTGNTASSWSDGGHTRVYVDPEFPIKEIAQKDKNVENILVFGIDSRGSDDIQCRADAIMIVCLNHNSKEIKLISLMRDTGVTIEGRSSLDKLGHSYAYGGVGLLINTINDNFGLDIQRFVMLDFNSSAQVIDQIGGIELEVKSQEVKYANLNIDEQNSLFGTNVEYLTHEGYQTLSGNQAVAWARIRYSDSDFVRTSRQRTLVYALMQKVSLLGKGKQLAVLEDLAGLFETNMNSIDLIRVGTSGTELIKNMSEYRVPEDGLYSVQQSPWMMVVDWENQVAALHEYIWGES